MLYYLDDFMEATRGWGEDPMEGVEILQPSRKRKREDDTEEDSTEKVAQALFLDLQPAQPSKKRQREEESTFQRSTRQKFDRKRRRESETEEARKRPRTNYESASIERSPYDKRLDVMILHLQG